VSSTFTTRKFLKLVHEMGSIGMTGALAIQWLMLEYMPPIDDLTAYAAVRVQMGMVAKWVLFPSLAAVLVSGLLAMAWTDAYLRAGWVWLKLLLGVTVFEWTLLGVQGPARKEAELAARALAGEVDPTLLGATAGQEWTATLVMLLVAVANVVISIWRPKFSKRSQKDSAAASDWPPMKAAEPGAGGEWPPMSTTATPPGGDWPPMTTPEPTQAPDWPPLEPAERQR